MNKITLHPIFQSHMILQRQKPIHIWGSAPKNSTITMTLQCQTILSAPMQTFSLSALAQADDSGQFEASLPPVEAAKNCSLQISSDASDVEDILLADISIGDIWFACGQSNMEFFLRYDKDWDTVKNYPKNPDIRVYNVPQTAFEGHCKNTPGYGRWMEDGDSEMETFSAPGYSFARNIQPHLQIPIGIIGCNWGGTTATAWLDEKNLEKEPLNIYLKEYEEALSLYSLEEMKELSIKAWEFEDSPKHGEEFMPLLYGRDYPWQEQYMKEHACDPVIPLGPYNINRPGGLYHLMLEPLIPFAMKGVLWYQGESDAGHADIYDTLLTTLIQEWRKKWKDDFPFLFVQLAPFGVWLACDSTNYAAMRKQQEKISQTVPNTGMVSIMDIGSYYDIHPKEKMEVGRRLALLARGKVYGHSILCESPKLICATQDKQTITLTFSHCQNLHTDNKRNDFVLTQNKKEIPIEKVEIKGNAIHLTASQLDDGTASAPDTVNETIISLADADYAEIHIYNEENLPLLPFSVFVK